MKMKKGLLMVVLLLALSSIMAAMSYTSATVTSAMSGTVVNTNKALLALTESGHAASFIDDGILNIDFDKGYKANKYSNDKYGLQKNSQYIWNEMFGVKNNSENSVKVEIKTANALPPHIDLYVGQDGNWTKIDNYNSYTINKLDSDKSANIDIKVIIGKDATMKSFTPNLVVSGEALTNRR